MAPFPITLSSVLWSVDEVSSPVLSADEEIDLFSTEEETVPATFQELFTEPFVSEPLPSLTAFYCTGHIQDFQKSERGVTSDTSFLEQSMSLLNDRPQIHTVETSDENQKKPTENLPAPSFFLRDEKEEISPHPPTSDQEQKLFFSPQQNSLNQHSLESQGFPVLHKNASSEEWLLPSLALEEQKESPSPQKEDSVPLRLLPISLTPCSEGARFKEGELQAPPSKEKISLEQAFQVPAQEPGEVSSFLAPDGGETSQNPSNFVTSPALDVQGFLSGPVKDLSTRGVSFEKELLPPLHVLLNQVSGRLEVLNSLSPTPQVPPLKIHLDPPHLGVLEVYVTFEDTQIFLKFTGEGATIHLLQHHAETLSQNLEQQGLNVSAHHMAFEFSSSDTFDHSQKVWEEAILESQSITQDFAKPQPVHTFSQTTLSSALPRVDILLTTGLPLLPSQGDLNICL